MSLSSNEKRIVALDNLFAFRIAFSLCAQFATLEHWGQPAFLTVERIEEIIKEEIDNTARMNSPLPTDDRELTPFEGQCESFANDLQSILKDGKIPDHDHWNDNQNCDNLRNLIAAFARKHFKLSDQEQT